MGRGCLGGLGICLQTESSSGAYSRVMCGVCSSPQISQPSSWEISKGYGNVQAWWSGGYLSLQSVLKRLERWGEAKLCNQTWVQM